MMDAINLSARQREILAHLIEGESDKVIAQKMVISRRTASWHVEALLRKLGVKNRVQAAVWGALQARP